MTNSQLNTAKKGKKDEFYTLYVDIEKELKHYKKELKDKYIYCNTDGIESNFWKYFKDNFNNIGLKHLTATKYNKDGNGIRLDYDGKNTIETILQGNGDYTSQECIDILKKCDTVITNPPFSLFRNFVAQLVQYDKKFLIIGNMNAITYKEIFPLIKENKILVCTNNKRYNLWFEVPENYECKSIKGYREENGKKYLLVNGTIWFTNINNKKRNTPLDLYKKYTPDEYPHYDNYDAIECGKVADIPMDYDGVIGVPITFIDKYCPEQFEIIGLMSGAKGEGLTNGNDGRDKFYVNEKGVYARILIRKK